MWDKHDWIKVIFFFIGKDTIHIKRDAKKATQGIQYLYAHLQKG